MTRSLLDGPTNDRHDIKLIANEHVIWMLCEMYCGNVNMNVFVVCQHLILRTGLHFFVNYAFNHGS